MSSSDLPNPYSTVTDQANVLDESQRETAVRFFQHRQNAISTVRRSRAANTAFSYARKQQQWREWCNRNQFGDGELVSQDKLLAWLQEELFDRQIQPRRNQNESATDYVDETEIIARTFSPSTIEVYVSAVIDLYHRQVKHNLNTNTLPRTPLLTNLLSTRRSQESQRRKDEFVDRGRGTLQEGYNKDQFSAMIRWCYTGSESTSALLRTAVDFLLTHHMLLRSEAR